MARRKGLQIKIHVTFHSLVWCFGISWDQLLSWDLHDTFLCCESIPSRSSWCCRWREKLDTMRREQLYEHRAPRCALFPFGNPHIKWLPRLEQWWRHCAVQCLGIWQLNLPGSLANWTVQLCHWDYKAIQNDGACDPEEGCLFQADTTGYLYLSCLFYIALNLSFLSPASCVTSGISLSLQWQLAWFTNQLIYDFLSENKTK